MKKIFLRKDEDRRLLAGHCWIYSNEIDTSKTPLKQFIPGELVQVISAKNKFLGSGYINPKTLLCVRMLTRDSNQNIDAVFISHKILMALKIREVLFPKPFYRLIYGEADGLPGLVIDRHGDYFVIQITTAGMEQLKSIVVDAIISLFNPKGVLLKNDSFMRELEGLDSYTDVACGDMPETISIEENLIPFHIPVKKGQKTGWFYDHRANRAAILPLAKNRNVLDLFSYVGGFGIQIAVHHAKQVTCIDSSALAIEYINANAKLNNVATCVNAIKEDVFEFLAAPQKNQFDMILLDPPALIKRSKDLAAGIAAYSKLHSMALALLPPGGILVSSSCSMHLMRDQLLDIIRKASLKQNKEIVILQQLHQSSDHPIHPAIKETEYLKGFIVISKS